MDLPAIALAKEGNALVRSKRSSQGETTHTNRSVGNPNIYGAAYSIYKDLYMENFRNSVLKSTSATTCVYSAIQVYSDAELASRSMSAAKTFMQGYDSFMNGQ